MLTVAFKLSFMRENVRLDGTACFNIISHPIFVVTIIPSVTIATIFVWKKKKNKRQQRRKGEGSVEQALRCGEMMGEKDESEGMNLI